MKKIKTVKTDKNQVKTIPQLQSLDLEELDTISGGRTVGAGQVTEINC